ncbi:MAG: lysophospholipase [Oscillospiraceae bacterium]|nr:lysophospholipase [Oscillospiraceae bacterium]
MTEHRFTIKGAQGYELHSIMWAPPQPRAVLQIVHGMTEHMGRYEKLAQYLTDRGIAVTGFDLRGHGVTPGDSRCAAFGEKGWQNSLEDMHLFFEYTESQLPGIPHFILGFSLGSFLLREYIGIYDDTLRGAIIMGTGHQPAPVLGAIIAIVNGQVKKAGIDSSTPLVQQLSFGTYNKKFAPNRTESDWLCSDNRQLDDYIADPLCRESISAGMFRDLLSAMKRTGAKTAYDNVDKTTPVLLISGGDDPVGDMGKGVAAVEKAMEKAGMQNTTTLLIAGARHDLLHEETGGQAETARKVIADWLDKNI